MGRYFNVRYRDSFNTLFINLSTKEVYFDKEGQEAQKTEWHQVVFWNKVDGVNCDNFLFLSPHNQPVEE